MGPCCPGRRPPGELPAPRLRQRTFGLLEYGSPTVFTWSPRGAQVADRPSEGEDAQTVGPGMIMDVSPSASVLAALLPVEKRWPLADVWVDPAELPGWGAGRARGRAPLASSRISTVKPFAVRAAARRSASSPAGRANRPSGTSGLAAAAPDAISEPPSGARDSPTLCQHLTRDLAN